MAINIRRADLVYPYFVTGGKKVKEGIASFPGQFRFSPDLLLKDIGELSRSGVNKVLLFGVPGKKDASGSFAYMADNVISGAVRDIKKRFSNIIIFTDVCLCAYTSHGHCGVIPPGSKTIAHRATLEALSRMALSHAEAGADYVAPSAMAEGQVAAVRRALDNHGHKSTKIMGYSAKFASNFYGPFRNAAGSAPKFGDRSGYQLDYGDPKRALAEIANDIKEGADIVMVKPALAYLDIIREAASRFRTPLAAYNVSGEYAMVKYGAKLELWDEKRAVFEIMTSIKRAGANMIITYHAKDIAKWLKER